ncbi:MAG: cytochrome c biogenesis protein CcdA [Coriobacteriia bacterium]|nr:cytochrome c biogenesis protein CcdA [Coriobacteriia bacterium]MBN2821886.1 cytochrome c biogenesis protein CcdA [Coriobacteriia bacterium]
MEASSITLLSAFVGGLLSFLAPCVLPLIPGYLSFMTGMSNAELKDSRSSGMGRVMVPALLFTAGFSSVFILIGAAAGMASRTLGPVLSRYDQVLQYAAGAVVILIGVFMLGLIKIPWLYGEARFEMGKTRRFGRGAAFVMGLAFGFGWTPCVGPILTVILGLAAQTGDTLRAAILLAAYSAGLALPFLLTAAFFGKMTTTLQWFTRHSIAINRTAGVILIIMGLLIFTGQLGRLSSLMLEIFPFLSALG